MHFIATTESLKLAVNQTPQLADKRGDEWQHDVCCKLWCRRAPGCFLSIWSINLAHVSSLPMYGAPAVEPQTSSPGVEM
jgi:hypothetical protein